METKWLEDFVSLAETRSFSRSAQLRHVTQPAFSRRIQSLEAWAGVDLVDRSSYPTRLTEAGQTLYAQAIEILQTLQTTRALLRQHTAVAKDVIEFAVPHTLAFTFFPTWLSRLRAALGPIKTRLVALNVRDAADHGARVRTRTRAEMLHCEDGMWIVDARDDQGHQYRFTGRSVVNAAGPAVLDLLKRADAEPDHQMRLVRGSHIVVPALFRFWRFPA